MHLASHLRGGSVELCYLFGESSCVVRGGLSAERDGGVLLRGATGDRLLSDGTAGHGTSGHHGWVNVACVRKGEKQMYNIHM